MLHKKNIPHIKFSKIQTLYYITILKLYSLKGDESTLLIQKDSNDMFENDIHFLKEIQHFPATKLIKFGSIESLTEFTLNTRSGIHNNKLSNKECLIFIEKGVVEYSDNLKNTKLLNKNDVIYINSGEELNYNIFNSEQNISELLVLTMNSSKNLLIGYVNFNHINMINNQCIYLASNFNGLAPIKCINDINIYTMYLTTNNSYNFHIRKNRQGYLFLYSGSLEVETESGYKFHMNSKDGMEIYEEDIYISALDSSNFILIEMNVAIN